MIVYSLLSVGSALLTLALALWVGWRLNRRLLKRLLVVRTTLEAIRELENRRVGTESGRESLVRARAGKPAKVGDGFRTKPGSLARAAQDERPSNK